MPEGTGSDLESDDPEVSDQEDLHTTSDEDPDDIAWLVNLVNKRKWEPVDGNRLAFNIFPQNTGVKPDVETALAGKDPIDFFNYLIDEDMINLFVTETNRFAAQNIIAAANSGNQAQKARLAKWVDTNPSEMLSSLE